MAISLSLNIEKQLEKLNCKIDANVKRAGRNARYYSIVIMLIIGSGTVYIFGKIIRHELLNTQNC